MPKSVPNRKQSGLLCCQDRLVLVCVPPLSFGFGVGEGDGLLIFRFFAEAFLELQSCPLEHFVVRRAQSLFSSFAREMFLLYFLLNVASYHFSLIWVSVLVLLLEPPQTVRRMSGLVGMRHWPHLSASKEQSIRNCHR